MNKEQYTLNLKRPFFEHRRPFYALLMLAFFLCTVPDIAAQNVGINNTGATPNPNAILDVDVSTNDKGVLLPRLSTAQRTGIAGLGATDEGLTVYDETTTSFWFWDGAQWVEIQNTGSVGAGWLLNGNTGTTNGTDFLGTTDAQDLDIRTNNVVHVRITQKGQIEILNTGGSVFVGFFAGDSDDLSNNANTFVGTQAGRFNTSGSFNTALGSISLRSNITGEHNTVGGYAALYWNTSGNRNTAFGSGSLNFSTTANNNTAIGYTSMYANTTGYVNTAVGTESLWNNTIGNSNQAFGYKALYNNNIGSANTAIGRSALASNTSGWFNIAVGNNSLSSNTSGNNNVVVGNAALTFSIGNDNTAMGHQALSLSNSGSGNTAGGYQALMGNTIGSNNTTFGNLADVLSNNLTNATAIGYNAKVGTSNSLVLGATGTNAVNVGIGTTTPSATLDVEGSVQIVDGNEAVGKVLTSDVAGNATWQVLPPGDLIDADLDTQVQVEESPDEDIIRFDLTGTEQWVMQGARLEAMNSGSSIFIGEDAGANDDLSINQNVFIGNNAGNANTIGSDNVAYGFDALFSNIAGSNATAIGNRAMYYSNNTNTAFTNPNVAVGFEALRGSTNASLNTGSNNTALGYATLRNNSTGYYNTAGGYRALDLNSSGYRNTAYGSLVLVQNTTGVRNTAIGDVALYSNSTGSYNTATGSNALWLNTTGSYNSAFGRNTLAANTTQSYNTALGYSAYSGGNYSNSTGLGYNAGITASNQIRLGNGPVNSIGGTAAWTNLSDGRFKTNVSENVVGLDFIMQLRPVTYNLDMDAMARFNNVPDSMRLKDAERIKSAELQVGFIAQEVEAAAQKIGFDFHGVDKPLNEASSYGLRYAEFVAPLVKAVQEQQVIILEQKQANEQLQKTLDLLIERLDLLESNGTRQ